MAKWGFSDENKYANAAHEIGHSLKLAHNSQSSFSSIMWTGYPPQTLTTTQCLNHSIYYYDNNDQINKWGAK